MLLRIHLIYLLISICSLSSAYAQDFVIKNFQSNIKIHKEGFMDVNEKIAVHFNTARHGIYRAIPFRYPYKGKSYTTKIKNVSVMDHHFETFNRDGIKIIKIGNADAFVEGDQEYNIYYRVENSFITAGNWDEFYWNVTGNEWQVPIEKVIYDIELPDDTKLDFHDQIAYTGRFGSKQDSAYIQQSGRHILGQTMKGLNPGEGITVALKLPLQYIDQDHVMDVNATTAQLAMKELKHQWPFAILPAGLITLIVSFWNRLRKRYPPFITTEEQPYPPDNMTPAEVGGFYDFVVNNRDVVSLLPYWAYQGLIRMEYDQNSNDTFLIKLNEIPRDRNVYELELFDNLFNYRDRVKLSSLRTTFSSIHARVKGMIHDEIVSKQLYDQHYRYWFKSWRGWLISGVFLPIGITLIVFGFWLAGACCLIGVIAGIIILLQPDVLSSKGYELKQRLTSFHDFIKVRPSNEFANVTSKDPQYFEKVYPYAVAFGLDKLFIQKVQPYYPNGPAWYGYYGVPWIGGSGHLSSPPLSDFTRHFEPHEITSAFTAPPMDISSGKGGLSGGSFGGGFSGGGFGGGGGGSW